VNAKRLLLPIAVFLAAPGILGAQVPAGPEFRVNTFTAAYQRSPSIASSLGEFVVVWESNYQDGSQYGVFGQRYLMTGGPQGGEFRVNTYTTYSQFFPDVASAPNGNFVVVWQSGYQDGDGRGIYAQRYAAGGIPQGAEFRVNTYTTSDQTAADVAIGQGATFVVVWASAGQDGSDTGVFGQRYSSTGFPLGPEFQINTYTTGAQRFPAVAIDAGGDFMVVWEGYGPDDASVGIFGQHYSSSGDPDGGEFRVNSYTTSSQRYPAIASDIAGNFVVAWQSSGQDGSGYGVFAQRYAGTTPVGGEFRVNTFTTLNQLFPALTMNTNGRMFITWQDDLVDGSDVGIVARYYVSWTPVSEFRVNTYTTGPRAFPVVTSDQSNRFTFAWVSSQDPDGSLGIYAQRYADVPVELQSFVVE
jgi:hypothetical protein